MTPDQAQEIHQRFDYRTPTADEQTTAASYGVSETLVTEIIRGNRWGHVGGPIRSIHGNVKGGV